MSDPLRDSTPITEAWLLSAGFKAVESDRGPRYADHYELQRLNIWKFNDTDKWLFTEADNIEMTTRGDVRMLGMLLRIFIP
jgi:hypothetical protein